MKINFYKYVLMTMAVLLGFHLYDTIVSESVIFFYSIEYPEMLEYMAEMRLLMNFGHILTFIFCMVLLVIAIGLYLAEFYICKYIKGKRE